MRREWKPGDVAEVTDSQGRSGRAMRGAVGWDFTPSGKSLNAYSGEKEPIAAHPMLVLDPRRLTWDGRVPSGAEVRAWLESMPAAEFATGLLRVADALDDLPAAIAPEPTPEEPTNPKARVTDRRENIWRLLADGDWVCTSGPDCGEYLNWDQLAGDRGPVTIEVDR